MPTDWIMPLLTTALVIITAYYAFVTHRIASATGESVRAVRQQMEAGLRPYVTVVPWVPAKSPLFYLRIRNDGRTAATNLRLTIDRDFFQYGEKTNPDKNIATFAAFTRDISSLAPGQQLTWGLAQGFVLFGESADQRITPTQFSITARYTFGGQTVEETNEIDLRPYSGAILEPDPLLDRLDEIAKALKESNR